MLRLLATQGLYDLCTCSHLVASCVIKRKATRLLPVSSACHRPHVLGRTFNTGSPVWKDAPRPQIDQSGELDTTYLDKWKSVMRSNVAPAEKVSKGEEANEDGENDEPGDTSKCSSSLAATREMVAMWREAGKFVPEEMTDEQVRIVAELTTKSARKKYLKFLAIKEGYKRTHKEKQQQRMAEKEAMKEQKGGQDSGAEEPKNTFVRKFWSRSLDQLLAWRSAQAMLFDQPLVIDMSYDSKMSRRELDNTVFHLHFCNLQEDGAYMQELLKRYGAETWDRLLVTSSHRQHVDMFPREQLVYLTADSRNVLRKFDHSKVYVIGALVDRSIQPGLSLANAKRLKLATARLPLDEFLHWEIGAKNLTLDQMIRIMLTIKETGKWEEALKFVPQRKHDGFHQQKTQRVTNNNRVIGATNHGQRLNVDRTLSSREETFKSEGPSFHGSRKESGLNKAAGTKVRTSFKSNIEGRKGAGKNKTWWDEE